MKYLSFLIILLFFNKIAYSQELYVAVIDTGIGYENSKFKNRIKINLDIFQKNNFEDVKDYNDHGSHIGHIILNNTVDQVVIVPYKQYNKENEGKIQGTATEMLNKAVFSPFIENIKKNKIKLVNISGGYNVYQEKDFEAFKNASDVLFIVASGNNVYSDDTQIQDLDKLIIASHTSKNHKFHNKFKYGFYPCAYQLPNIVCVSNAVVNEKLGEVKILANYGSFVVDVFANGENVVSNDASGKMISMTGSSMSTPKVTALFANEMVKNPKLSITELKEKVYSLFKQDDFLKQFSKYGYYLDESILKTTPVITKHP